jgi:expansin (peptidoglycan-binding protein)
MQVVNTNEPVTQLEVSTDNGASWTDTTRTYYNFFEKDGGFGTGTVDVRVTGSSGKKVVVKGVGCGSGEVVQAGENF